MTAARKLPEQPKKGSTIAFAGTDLPGRSAKSAAELIASAPKKFSRHIRHERLSRAEYLDGVAVGHVFLDAELATLTSCDEVTAALARGEVWEG